MQRSAAGHAYVTGGVGSDERDAFQARADEFNLRLTLADPGGAFLSGVAVRVEDAGTGEVLLEGESKGPFFWMQLPEGTYRVRVDRPGGESVVRTVVLAEGESVRRVIHLRANP